MDKILAVVHEHVQANQKLEYDFFSKINVTDRFVSDFLCDLANYSTQASRVSAAVISISFPKLLLLFKNGRQLSFSNARKTRKKKLRNKRSHSRWLLLAPPVQTSEKNNVVEK